MHGSGRPALNLCPICGACGVLHGGQRMHLRIHEDCVGQDLLAGFRCFRYGTKEWRSMSLVPSDKGIRERLVVGFNLAVVSLARCTFSS